MTVVNTSNSEHYQWGIKADGWHLLKSDSLSVIEERVPPGESEQRHFHGTAQQFFYVLSGVATLELDGEILRFGAGSGVHVPANAAHQLKNETAADLRFLVISQPKSHGDRTSA